MKLNDNFYTIDGVEYPRVSRVLSIIRNKSLETWRGKVGNKEANLVMREASKVGTRLHKLIEKALYNEKIGIKKTESKEVLACLEGFKEWALTRNPKPLGVEVTVVSREYGYAGTIDLIEEGIITDWKTAARLSPSYWIQLAAYANACREESRSIDKVRIVRLDKTLGIFEEQEKTVEELAPFWVAFRALLDFYKQWEQIGKEEEDDDTDNRSGEDESADTEVEGGPALDKTEVSYDWRREDWKKRVLGSGGHDPLSGM